MPKISAIQLCSSNNIDENLAVTKDLILEAVSNGAQLIVLPEMFSIMGLDEKDKIQFKETLGQGKVQNFLSQLAKENNIWIVGGTIPVECGDANKVYSTSFVFNNEGIIVASYNKIHLFDVSVSADEIYKESNTIQAGNDIVVVSTPFGKLGIAVCYDLRFPELFRVMFNNGAEIICVPSAFTAKTGEAHWEVLLRCRAIENFSYVVGAAQGGKHANGRQTHGHSMIVDPWGKIIAAKDDDTPGVIVAEIDLKKLREIRQSIPVAEHQRIFFSTSLK